MIELFNGGGGRRGSRSSKSNSNSNSNSNSKERGEDGKDVVFLWLVVLCLVWCRLVLAASRRRAAADIDCFLRHRPSTSQRSVCHFIQFLVIYYCFHFSSLFFFFFFFFISLLLALHFSCCLGIFWPSLLLLLLLLQPLIGFGDGAIRPFPSGVCNASVDDGR